MVAISAVAVDGADNTYSVAVNETTRFAGYLRVYSIPQGIDKMPTVIGKATNAVTNAASALTLASSGPATNGFSLPASGNYDGPGAPGGYDAGARGRCVPWYRAHGWAALSAPHCCCCVVELVFTSPRASQRERCEAMLPPLALVHGCCTFVPRSAQHVPTRCVPKRRVHVLRSHRQVGLPVDRRRRLPMERGADQPPARPTPPPSWGASTASCASPVGDVAGTGLGNAINSGSPTFFPVSHEANVRLHVPPVAHGSVVARPFLVLVSAQVQHCSQRTRPPALPDCGASRFLRCRAGARAVPPRATSGWPATTRRPCSRRTPAFSSTRTPTGMGTWTTRVSVPLNTVTNDCALHLRPRRGHRRPVLRGGELQRRHRRQQVQQHGLRQQRMPDRQGGSVVSPHRRLRPCCLRVTRAQPQSGRLKPLGPQSSAMWPPDAVNWNASVSPPAQLLVDAAHAEPVTALAPAGSPPDEVDY